jgi:hypothetical protein
MTQSEAMAQRVQECTVVIAGVLEKGPHVDGEGNVVVPDYRRAAIAAEELRDLANASGHLEAAQFCEGTRQFACDALASVQEQVLQFLLDT